MRWRFRGPGGYLDALSAPQMDLLDTMTRWSLGDRRASREVRGHERMFPRWPNLPQSAAAEVDEQGTEWATVDA